MIKLPFDKLGGLQLDNKKILLIAVISFMIAYLDFAYILKAQLNGIKTVGPKIVKLRKDMDNLNKELPRLQDLERNKGKLKQQAGQLRHKEIIKEDRILLLLQEITDLANKNNVKITQINTTRDTKAKEETIAGERLLPAIINLNLSCGYHSLGRFMNSFASAKYFIDVQDMKIARDTRNYMLQNVNMVLKTYVRK
ncbi:MAG: type 4a pilus biogenesis protein PilO [Candidatus Omnitrophica bacterium]|nr:type 4a pilus biogenesis protein PilO [Candidatus Omnitrophota bacterium]MDD5552633.1 type 4a pilus biogenesis protein PilO [Candidatus Omnitrophota bacterium]